MKFVPFLHLFYMVFNVIITNVTDGNGILFSLIYIANWQLFQFFLWWYVDVYDQFAYFFNIISFCVGSEHSFLEAWATKNRHSKVGFSSRWIFHFEMVGMLSTIKIHNFIQVENLIFLYQWADWIKTGKDCTTFSVQCFSIQLQLCVSFIFFFCAIENWTFAKAIYMKNAIAFISKFLSFEFSTVYFTGMNRSGTHKVHNPMVETNNKLLLNWSQLPA